MKTAIIFYQHTFVSGKTALVTVCENTEVLEKLRQVAGTFLEFAVELAAIEDGIENCDFKSAWINPSSIEFDDQYPIPYTTLTRIN